MSIVDRTVNGARGARAAANWQQILKDAVRDPIELCRLLELPAWCEEGARRSAQLFPVFAPRGFIDRMRKRDVRDPLLRQVLPLEEEQPCVEGFTADPLDELRAAASPGLLHKYRNRALIVATGACAVHCRYCFRRHFPYESTPRSPADWQPALDTIAQNTNIREVILSGGDPLTLVDRQLSALVRRVAKIAHVRRLRIHTRLPIMIPERVTTEMLDWLLGTRLKPIFVIHANHAAELAEPVERSIATLVDSGVPVLNQSVLLRGVNDEVQTLCELSERLVDLRVMPYYLHQLDRVAGAAHFEVDVRIGRKLIRQMRARLPGYAVPRYVREVPGQPNKVVLA